MVDCHSHFLPSVDDGADCVETSLEMLEESRRQGVSLMVATPHFYADEDDPESFLERRAAAYRRLCRHMKEEGGDYPEIMLGAEILYFPGMSVAEELFDLRMGESPLLLIEPPMMPWSDNMLDEVELTGQNLNCVPIIAHVDRYMRMLRDYTLLDRLMKRNVYVQVNASFFIRPSTALMALDYLRNGCIHFIGSDCHNMEERAPNMGQAAEILAEEGAARALKELNDQVYSLLEYRRKR